MSFYNTGNPVPSIDPRDLDDNAKHIDELTNSTFPTFVDRMGAQRFTLAGLEAEVTNTPPRVLGTAVPDRAHDAAVAAWDVFSINGSSSSRGAQAFAFDTVGRNIFFMEGDILSRFPMDGPIGIDPIDASLVSSSVLGHQGLAVDYADGTLKFWTTSASLGRSAVRFSYVAGAEITTGDVYELFPSGTYANNSSCTPAVSPCGNYLVAHGALLPNSAVDGRVRVFRVADLLAHGPGDCTGLAIYEWSTLNIANATNPVQGMACDGAYVYVQVGGTGFTPDVLKRLYAFTLDGKIVYKDDNFFVGRARSLLDPDGTRYEAEGLGICPTGVQGSLSLAVGILSGSPGQRRYRVYLLGAIDPIHTAGLYLDGNTRSAITPLKAAGRNGMQIMGGPSPTTGAGLVVGGNADSVLPSQIGIQVGASNQLQGTIALSASGDHLTFNSLNGELRHNAPLTVRIQVGAASYFAASNSSLIAYQPVIPAVTGTTGNGSVNRRWSEFFSINGNFSGPVIIGQFTLATLPSASAFNGYLITVTDATGGAKVCRSNGTVWQILNTTTTVS